MPQTPDSQDSRERRSQDSGSRVGDAYPRHDLFGTARTDCRPRQTPLAPPLAFSWQSVWQSQACRVLVFYTLGPASGTGSPADGRTPQPALRAGRPRRVLNHAEPPTSEAARNFVDTLGTTVTRRRDHVEAPGPRPTSRRVGGGTTTGAARNELVWRHGSRRLRQGAG